MLRLLAPGLVQAAWAGSRSRSLRCSLNGVLEGVACACDAPWTGEKCELLDILPSPNDYVPAYGAKPNITSWGGSAILGDDGLYHLFVSEMAGGAGLLAWQTASRIAHATSSEPMGVFVKQDLPLGGPWAHNSAPVRAPAVHDACPRCWYLFHIGSGHPENQGGNNQSGFAHRAGSPAGPWQPLPFQFGCNNPAPAFAANGTLFVVCSNRDIYRADGDPVVAGAWSRVCSIDTSPWEQGGYTHVEDMFLWQDPNDNWHLLAHRYDFRNGYPKNPNATEPVLVSGHAFSTDLYAWTLSSTPPFESLVKYQNGSTQHFATMERPHLIFDSSGYPTHVTHGVSPIWDQYGAPCNVCDKAAGVEHSCVTCKCVSGYDWTYTIIRELRRGQTSYVPAFTEVLAVV